MPEGGHETTKCALPANYITKTLEDGQLDSLSFVNHFIPLFHPPLMDKNVSTYFKSLIAFAYAERIYSTLPRAEISLTVFTKAFYASNWAEALLDARGVSYPSRSGSLACIALFETGYLDLKITDLDDVLAISSGNSIYASEILFSDPYDRPPEHIFRHVIGNVGKPGLALLLSPRDTAVREPDLDTWRLVNHAKFDGCFENSFTSTTLHLSLTGFEQRLNTSRYQCRDKEAFYLEAVVQVYDKGTWVADLDLLHLVKGSFSWLPNDCKHDLHSKRDFLSFSDLTSIDNWYEYLDRPPNNAIIRAKGNWVARLALAAIPLADKESLIIGSEKICWGCVKDMLTSSDTESSQSEDRLVLC